MLGIANQLASTSSNASDPMHRLSNSILLMRNEIYRQSILTPIRKLPKKANSKRVSALVKEAVALAATLARHAAQHDIRLKFLPKLRRILDNSKSQSQTHTQETLIAYAASHSTSVLADLVSALETEARRLHSCAAECTLCQLATTFHNAVESHPSSLSAQELYNAFRSAHSIHSAEETAALWKRVYNETHPDIARFLSTHGQETREQQ
jgi:hypothetical protein